MELLKSAAVIVLAVFCVANVALVLYTKRNELSLIGHVWRRFTRRMLAEVLATILAVVVVGLLLMKVPALSVGWMNLFMSGPANALVTSISAASTSSYEVIRWLPVGFLAALLLAVPFMAQVEEQMFRQGYVKWGRIVWQSFKFGIMHCIVGVPLAFGVALSISGLLYGYQYRSAYRTCVLVEGHEAAEEAAVMASTVYHTLYNTVLIAILLILTTVMTVVE